MLECKLEIEAPACRFNTCARKAGDAVKKKIASTAKKWPRRPKMEERLEKLGVNRRIFRKIKENISVSQ